MTPLGVWPTAPARPSSRRHRDDLPFPLTERSCRLFGMARHGLWTGARALGLGAGDVVLAPAYHHGSEIEALSRTGVDCRFYELDAELGPDEVELETRLGPDVRALLLVHPLGFPQDSPRWRRWCDERGLLLLEDAAQSWLATIDDRPLGSWGDLGLFSLHKTVAVPDGGALVGLEGLPPSAPNGTGSHLWWRAKSSPPANWLRARLVGMPPYQPLEDFALGDPTRPPAPITGVLLPRLARADIAGARRSNYEWMLNELGDRVAPLFATVPAGASPMVFAIEVDDKAAALATLARHGVLGLDYWSVPHPLLPLAEFPRSAGRRRRVIGVPVHQDLTPGDLARVATAASEVESSAGS